MNKEQDKPLSGAALLVIDMQDAFLSAIPKAQQLTQRCQFAINASQLLGAQVIFTEQVPDKLGPTNSTLLTEANTVRVHHKSSFSALRLNELTEDLNKSECKHIILAGIETPICIYQTALDAINQDFGVTLFTDCIGERRYEDRQHALNTLTAANCFALASETVFYAALGSANHPHFREYSKLVKQFS